MTLLVLPTAPHYEACRTADGVKPRSRSDLCKSSFVKVFLGNVIVNVIVSAPNVGLFSTKATATSYKVLSLASVRLTGGPAPERICSLVSLYSDPLAPDAAIGKASLLSGAPTAPVCPNLAFTERFLLRSLLRSLPFVRFDLSSDSCLCLRIFDFLSSPCL